MESAAGVAVQIESQCMANGNDMIRQSLLTIILAIAVGIGSSWVATQAQIAVMSKDVDRNSKLLERTQEDQMRFVTMLTKLEQKLGITDRDVIALRASVNEARNRMDGHVGTHPDHELRIRIALLEQKLGIEAQ